MPAQISFFDIQVISQIPSGPGAPLAIDLGTNWQPGDIRLVFLVGPYLSNFGCSTIYYPPNPNPPVGYTTLETDGFQVLWAYYQRLTASSVPTSVDWTTWLAYTNLWAFQCVLMTVRGVSPTASIGHPFTSNVAQGLVQTQTNNSYAYSAGHCAIPSMTVPSAGTMVVYMSAARGSIASSVNTGSALGMPAGWTQITASPTSGVNYYPYNQDTNVLVMAKAYSSSGSTGALTIPMGYASNSFANRQYCEVYCMTAFLVAAPDVSATAGTPPSTVATATNATFSTTTTVTATAGSASTVATATTAFNPLFGYWVSDPLTLPGSPVTGSVVRWAQSTPAGTSVVVETSINNGASWDTAANNGVVPRLATGDTTTRSVLVRVTLTRANAADSPPRVTQLEVQVSNDVGTDELVPIGHGMIDKVTTSSVGGSTGSGSVTSVTSSTAVTSRGGGQTGGGASIKIHVTDLSGSIKRNVWAQPYTVPSGLNYGDAAIAMVTNRLPSQTDFAISSTTRALPEVVVYGLQQGGDPWQDIQDLATAIGFEAFFDARGVFTFRPVPDPSVGDPVWVFDEDSNPLVAEASRELSSEQTFNHVIVVGQSTSTQNAVSAEAFDNNPSSPTYILGPYGEVTERLTFSLIVTQDQAQDTANALLYNSLGAADTVTITVVPMPALEPGDIIKIHCSDVKANGTYMINSMTTSMSPADPQQLVCFRQSTD